MKLLLDTHVFIWWASASENLSEKVLKACTDRRNELFLSVTSAWEMQIKVQLGKLELDQSLEELINLQRKTNNIQLLPISFAHILELGNLPSIHGDPFDRLLIAQAIKENLKLVSKDRVFSNYPVKLLW